MAWYRHPGMLQLPSQTQLDLQRQVEATERRMAQEIAELRQELKALQNKSAPQTAGGTQVNLQVLQPCLSPDAAGCSIQ